MRLGKVSKFNIVLAILLCMAFALDIGMTVASVAHSLFSRSERVVDGVKAEVFTGHSSVVVDSAGQIPYEVGSVEYNMSANYGVSVEHDLMLTMTIAYNNENHKLNDFSLNFANANMWSVDTPNSFENITQTEENKSTHYSVTSNTNSLTIALYYLGTISGSGQLPIISGVTFYNDGLGRSSTNLSATRYEGDYLTITITPYYTKVTASELTSHYSNSHNFYTHSVGDKQAFTNWCKYKSNSISDSTYMIYNDHGTDATGILFPQDFECPDDITEISSSSIINNSTTAYEYAITNSGGTDTISYSKLLAGNKYSGGVGVFVYPKSSGATVSINVTAYWEKGGVIMGTATTNPIHLQYSRNIIQADGQYCHYATITKPTYIKVLDSIMLTAQGEYEAIWRNGYKLIISAVDVDFISTTMTTEEVGYSVSNSTEISPVLARYVEPSSKNVNISIANTGSQVLKITSFTIQGKLWYADNSNALEYAEVVSYLSNDDAFVYDSDVWNEPVYSSEGSIYTFTAKQDTYIIPGYGMPLISGVNVPAHTYETVEGSTTYVQDRWCGIEIVDMVVAVKGENDSVTSQNYSVEVSAPNYWVPLEPGEIGLISIKNNTEQMIASLRISVEMMWLEDGECYREQGEQISTYQYELENLAVYSTREVTGPSGVDMIDVSIRPGERLAIWSVSSEYRCMISSVGVYVRTESTIYGQDVDMFRTCRSDVEGQESSYIVNNSDKTYEFRAYGIQGVVDMPECFVLDSDAGYAYYEGIIRPHQIINFGDLFLFSEYIDVISLEIDAAEHTGVYDDFGTSWDDVPEDWISAMQGIFQANTDMDDIIDKIKNAS